MFVAQPLPDEHEGAARRDPEAAHVSAVSEEVPLDPGPNRRRLLLQAGLRCPSPTSFKRYVALSIGCAFYSFYTYIEIHLILRFRNIITVYGNRPELHVLSLVMNV